MQNPEKTPERICEGATYLLAKNNDTKDQKNFTFKLYFTNQSLTFQQRTNF